MHHIITSSEQLNGTVFQGGDTVALNGGHYRYRHFINELVPEGVIIIETQNCIFTVAEEIQNFKYKPYHKFKHHHLTNIFTDQWATKK